MTRSKIFLGLTTCCLAIAGAVAAKVTHFGSVTAKYFTTGAHCVSATTFPCSVATGSLKTCIYTYTPNHTAIKIAVYTAVNNCTTLLKYSGE
jgi:hypothetical protein